MHVLISKLIVVVAVVVAAKCHKGFHWGGGGYKSLGDTAPHTPKVYVLLDNFNYHFWTIHNTLN